MSSIARESGYDRLRNVEDALSLARDLGLERVAEIAEREAAKLGLSQRTACEYLTRNLHYRLGSAERTALRLFHRLAARHGLAPEGARVRFRERRAAAIACES